MDLLRGRDDNPGQSVSWDPEFDKDSITAITPLIPDAQREIEKIAGRQLDFPRHVYAMTPREIEEGRKVGAGHGLFISPRTIKVNPNMGTLNIYANYIHENLHFAIPSNTEQTTDELTDDILAVLGHKV